MRTSRRQRATTVIVVLAVLLGSLWAGGLAVPAAGGPAGQLTAGASLPGIEPAALPDRAPALRPAVERPGPDGRLLPLLGGLSAASLAVASGVGAGRRRSSLAPARSLVLCVPRGPRARPASSRPDPLPRAVAIFQEIPDIGAQWTLVAAYGGRGVHRTTPARSDLAAGDWTVTIPAGATTALERAGYL